jgi:hypothetical protein
MEFPTLQQAILDVAGRLSASVINPLLAFWSSAELQSYLIEALQTWNAYTNFWRGDMVIPLLQNQTWYDIPSQSGSLRPYTMTDFTLLQQIEYHLLEPVSTAYPLVWSGSGQFGAADIIQAIQLRRDELIGASSCSITPVYVNAPFTNRVPLPQSVIDVRRVLWMPISGFGFQNSILYENDDFAQESFAVGDTTAPQQPPTTFQQSAQPPMSFDTDYVPPVPGQYEVLAVTAGNALAMSASQLLYVPDDWAWLIKWGSLATLFGREVNAKDALRAEYCEKRYQDGVQLLMQSPAVLAARLNNVPIYVDSVRNGDDFDVTWQSIAGPPTTLYTPGLNLIGAGLPDQTNAYSVTLRVVRNAPLPVLPTDTLQLIPDDYNAVLSEAQHLACLKMGGAEFAASIKLHENFLLRAALYNSKLLALGQFPETQLELSQLEQQRNPVYATEAPQQ